MTTNAIDRIKKIVATDSRWSIEKGQYMLFVDDTGFDKLADRHTAAIVFAGDGQLIQLWKDWFSTPILNTAALPPVERADHVGEIHSVTLFMLEKPTCRITLASGWMLAHEDEGIFAGSGAEFAKICFAKNGCSKFAVKTASENDPATGGETKFIELDTNRHNLSKAECSLADAEKQLWERGYIMDMNTRETMALSEFKTNATGALQSMERMTISAPTGLPTRRWSDAEKAELKSALEALAAREAAANKQ